MGAKNIVQGIDGEVLAKFDETFTEMFTKLSIQAIDEAKVCTDKMFNLTSGYLDKDSTQFLNDFHQLYFSDNETSQRKDDVNKDVDDMFEMAQKNLAEGKDVEDGIEEDDFKKKERLGLSGLQKQMEAMVSLDEGIRDKIFPALASMQFEDAVRQRLHHIFDLWKEILPKIDRDPETDFMALAREFSSQMSSIEETRDFYQMILKEEPPEAGIEGGALMF